MNEELARKLIEFREKRGWEKYHTPRNLAESISIEAAELLQCFQWGQSWNMFSVIEEIADVGIYLFYLCHSLGITIEGAIESKLIINEAKYPEGERHEW